MRDESWGFTVRFGDERGAETLEVGETGRGLVEGAAIVANA